MKGFFLLPLVLFVLSCNSNQKTTTSITEKTNALTSEFGEEHSGKKLMETHCYVCHSPDADHDNRIGPPMIAIKRHYINDETTQEEFVASMKSWIENPIEENAKMKGAVRRFGVMPKQVFPEGSIEQIAEYMFNNDIDQPAWFEEHHSEQKGKQKGKGKGMGRGKGKGKGQGNKRHQQQAQNDIQELSYGEQGLKYALATKAVLGKNLMGTIQKKGTLEALNFCNVKAYPLTDSMATVYNVNIKRISDKPRNINNNANKNDLTFIKKFKEELKSGKEFEPYVVKNNSNTVVYYPIVTNSMCLQCHGEPKTNISPKVLNRLATLYPQDKAVGYSDNQVRGAWKITLPN